MLSGVSGHSAAATLDAVCVATSATIVDRENPDAAREFASRFFGVDPESVATVGEAYEAHVWEEGAQRRRVLEAIPQRF